MRLLVTGFGPFPGVDVNVTAALARRLDGTHAFGVEIVGRVLDVSWTRAWPALQAHVEAVRPAAVVMLGVARDREQVCLERVARNIAEPRPDVDGALPEGKSLVDAGPAEVITGLPWRALCVDGVETSEDAGRYLCNALFYRAALELGGRMPVGFVHVPDVEDQEPAVALLKRVAAWIARTSQPPSPPG